MQPVTSSDKISRSFVYNSKETGSSSISLFVTAKMAELELSGFDKKSQVWLQPFSEIINCMFPMEYVYGEWIWWQATSEAKSIDPESLCSKAPSLIDTGSQVEGFCIPIFFVGKTEETFIDNPSQKRDHWQPDLDGMHLNDCFVVNKETDKAIPIFTVEHASDDPRYVHLRFTDEWKEHQPSYKNATFVNHTYSLPGKNYDDKKLSKLNEGRESDELFTYEMHGPVWKLEGKGLLSYEEDSTGVFKYPLAWPEPAMEWLVRSRTNGWPSLELLKDILESGCHLAPVGRGKRQNEPMEFLEYRKNPEKPSSSSCRETDPENPNDRDIMDETEWRLSFSVAENKLGQSVSPVQRHVLVLLKMIKKVYFPDVISSYLLKNLLFWEIENQDPSFWTEANSGKCLLLMLDRLQKSLEEGHLPHYIIPQSNLLQNEDPAKLAEGAAMIHDVRRSILTKTISLLKRCHSMTYQSQIYINNLQGLDLLVAKTRDKSLAEQDVTALTISVIALFIKQAKEEVKSMLRNVVFGDDENIKTLMHIPLYAYESVLARSLCKIWYLKPDKSSQEKSNEEEFKSFVRQETTELSTGDEFIALALAFYAEVRAGRDMSFLVPQTSVMERTKEIHREEARNQFLEAQAPVMEILGLLCQSDLKTIQKKVSEDLDGQLESLTRDRIEMEVTKEIQKLFLERCSSSQKENADDN
ncbi:uncharacterized protein LOC116286269 [Actinia tenebrosa]|uniref:Uncharacterized protein LOC116286269 n=1 Tax=Actinia tenebrosa TaxID=6105 RepID=A0A6P8H789_ACTTE|nr:uncharacterized protein LOC116286269 [Actinia tenebrosa]